MANNNFPEIVWTDKETGQKFVIDNGMRIYILSDGTRVSEEDLLLEQEMRLYMEEEEEREKAEQAEYEAMLLEDERQREAEREALEQEEFDNWWWWFGPGSEKH